MNSPQLIQKSISDVIGFSQDKQKPPVDSLETFSSETTLTGDSLSTNGGAMSWTKLIKLRKLIVAWIAHSN